MKPKNVLIVLASIIALLALLALLVPEEGISIGAMRLRYPTLTSVLSSNDNEPVAKIVNETIEPPEKALLRDSIAFYDSIVTRGDNRFWLPSSRFFDNFWHAAENARKEGRVVRVLHYGDSQIEMDRMSSRLRSYMQRTFGGGGPGMMSVRTIIPSPAYSISAPGQLEHLASFGDSTVVRSRGNYGPMMQCFRLGGGLTVSVRTRTSTRVDSLMQNINSVRLVFNNNGNSFKASIDTTSYTCSEHGVSSFEWKTDTVNRFKVKISGSADLYCLLADCGPGVAVDNIPMRGCSGQQFTLVDSAKLAAAYSQMDVGLIILQFGGNSVPYIRTTKAVSTYCQSLGRQIDHLHHCCPNATILFVGPSDMSKRRESGSMGSYPILPELIDSLAAMANAHNAAYWSIFHSMGGENSMTEWHRQGLAGADYIHFSQRGADLMGDRLAGALSDSYTLYCLKRKLR